LYINDYNLGKFKKESDMKKHRFFVMMLVLVLASLACQAFGGGGNDVPSAPPSNDETGAPSTSDSGENGGGAKSDYGFPVTKDAYNVTDFGENNIIYYTKMSMDDVMQFYRDEYTSMGYTEREILTVISDSTFSMVFDGDPSGNAVVIQSVDLGDGSRTVSIRFEDV